MADEDWETQAEEGAAGRVKVGIWVTWGPASLEPHGPAVLWPLCAPSTLWALSAMLLLAMSAPASCALCHPPPLDQPLQQGVGRKGWASGFLLPLHRENVQGWISDVCCGHSKEEGALRATHVLPGAYPLL